MILELTTADTELFQVIHTHRRSKVQARGREGKKRLIVMPVRSGKWIQTEYINL